MLSELTRSQAGVVSRAQAVRCGFTDSAIGFRIRSGRWQRAYPGVVATFSGPLPWRARLWAAVLFAGPGAVLSHRTAAELHGLAVRGTGPVHVSVLHTRRVKASGGGMVIHRVVDPRRLHHPARVPPRTTVTETVLDLVHTSKTLDEAVGWLLAAVGSRLTTADRIEAAMDRRSRLRWRRDLRAALDDAAAGCHSILEFRYRVVERAHRLPAGVRQWRRDGWYDDVAYPGYGVHVELDGRLAHPDGMRFRDHRRDNAAVVGGGKVLRYGYADVAGRACTVAAEVAGVLTASGWTSGSAAVCPDCISGEVRPRSGVDELPR